MAKSTVAVTLAPVDPVLDFMRLLWGVEHGLQSTSKRMARAIGITGPQRLVLRVVARFPGISAKHLAEVVHLHPSTVTGVLQRLIQKKLLAREVDPGDTRRIRLFARPEAKRLTRRSSGTVESALARALSTVSPAEVVSARRVLGAVAAALEQTGV